ncbi:MAG: NAD-dependent 4,6-dehydratase LegB [Paracoccaceae bacterium]
MEVLITGADGFIGSHLAERLVREGHSVRAFCVYNSMGSRGWLDAAPKDVLKNLDVVFGDIRDPGRVRSAVKGVDYVVHLAALIAIPYSYVSPMSYVDTNVVGTLNILEAARDFEIKRVLHTSTSEVYGTANYVPIDESHPLQAQSPYSASKISADSLAFSYYSSFNLPVVICRPFNTYGPRQSERAIIPTIITQVNSGNSHIKLGALTPTRDFNFIEDTVSGFLAALKSEKGIGEAVNFGSGFEISIKETVDLIGRVMGVDVSVTSVEERLRPVKSEVNRLVASNVKAKQLFDWSPNFAGIAGFEQGLQITKEWFSDPANLAAYSRNEYAI